jgi:hypothetical protein
MKSNCQNAYLVSPKNVSTFFLLLLLRSSLPVQNEVVTLLELKSKKMLVQMNVCIYQLRREVNNVTIFRNKY